MIVAVFRRGRERIRTAVEGFADLCLATRPRDRKGTANVVKKHLQTSIYTPLQRIFYKQRFSRVPMATLLLLRSYVS
jgi:hypothetical protein